jgi:hypothetical protein
MTPGLVFFTVVLMATLEISEMRTSRRDSSAFCGKMECQKKKKKFFPIVFAKQKTTIHKERLFRLPTTTHVFAFKVRQRRRRQFEESFVPHRNAERLACKQQQPKRMSANSNFNSTHM